MSVSHKYTHDLTFIQCIVSCTSFLLFIGNNWMHQWSLFKVISHWSRGSLRGSFVAHQAWVICCLLEENFLATTTWSSCIGHIIIAILSCYIYKGSIPQLICLTSPSYIIQNSWCPLHGLSDSVISSTSPLALKEMDP